MLRSLLERISTDTTAEENIRQVIQLAQTCSHSIVPLASVYPLNRYTCLVHALGFTGQHDYVCIADVPPRKVFAGAKFAEWLLHSGSLQEVPLANAVNADMVWYFTSDGSFKHVGLLCEACRVESKWGDLGLFEHPLWEVPESYGSSVRSFKLLPYDLAIQRFYAFAEENGTEFEPSAP